MNLELLRTASKDDFTLGILYEIPRPNPLMWKRKNDLAYTIEDEHRTKKVYGETRIPDGRYQIKLRTEGGFHQRYSKKFDWHEGMLEITKVPEFTNVLIHIGNKEDDTAGCVLVGRTSDLEGFVGHSTEQYEKVYKRILSKLKEGEQAWIDIKSYDFV